MVLPLIAAAAGRLAAGAAARAGAGAVTQRAAQFGGSAIARGAAHQNQERPQVPFGRAGLAAAAVAGPGMLKNASNQYSSVLQSGQFPVQ